MTLEIQFKIKKNPTYQKHIRENSHWYKILNRNPETFKNFEEEVKETYELRPIDRVNRMVESFELISTLFSSFNK